MTQLLLCGRCGEVAHRGDCWFDRSAVSRDPQTQQAIDRANRDTELLRDDWYQTWVAETERIAGRPSPDGRVVDPFLTEVEVPC